MIWNVCELYGIWYNWVNMKTLIVYATKTGAARECAEVLAKRIDEAAVRDLAEGDPDLAGYDTVIIGSGVRIGRIYGAVRKFIRRNLDELLGKRVAVYFCNADLSVLPLVIKKNVPERLAKRAIAMQSFGGKPPFNAKTAKNWMLRENIEEFVREVESYDKK